MRTTFRRIRRPLIRDVILLVALLAVGTECFAQKPKGQRWGLLIGVDEYIQMNDLEYCGADQRALRDQLVASGFPKDQVFFLNGKAKQKQFLPFRVNIEKQLDLVLNRLIEEGDVVVVAFSGHGVHFGKRSYLCPVDGDLDKPDTLIPMERVYERLKHCPAALKVLIVDACRDDPRRGGTRSPTSLDETKGFAQFVREEDVPEGVVLLNSCVPGEKSYEEKEFGHGVFMHFLLEGLKGKADGDKNGRISLGEVASYAGQQTKVYVARKFVDSQRPFVKGEYEPRALEFEIGPLLSNAITNSIGMKLVRIPSGEFQMGSGKSAAEVARLFDTKAEYFEDEHPQHRVRITRDFYLGAHEVTLGQFRRFVQATGHQTEPERDGEGGYGWNATKGKFEGRDPQYNWKNTGWTQTDQHPVVNVTWNDAVEFCRWLSRTEGKAYRLPTEAEWEYACRAGATTMYQHGDDPEELARVGNVADGSFKRKKPNGYDWGIDADDGYVFSAPVAQFQANAFGLYDMHGNVYEWCQDWYADDYYGKSPLSDPTGPPSGSSRVLRGGSWYDDPLYVRSASRYWNTADFRDFNIGFRVLGEL